MLLIDPMPALKIDAEEKINTHFNIKAAGFAQRDVEHALKRIQAQAVLDGGTPEPEFVEAARIENLEPRALAILIAGKPIDSLERANSRRSLIQAVRAAKTPSEIENLLVQANVITRPV